MNEPLNDNELYGLDEDTRVEPVCVLKENGVCPEGCAECRRFAEEMESK
jgi:hypothetical protein